MTNFTNNSNANNGKDNGNKDKEKLHIFINKIKFDETQGVKDQMTGGELADLVSVPRENADITRDRHDEQIKIDQLVEIHMADHFTIIRKVVHAGYGN